MSQTTAQFVGKLKKAPEQLRGNQVAAVRHASDAAKVVFQSAPGKPSKVAGKTVGVSNRMLKGGDSPSALVRYTGPAHLVDRPTKPHDIVPKQFVGTRGRGKRAQRGAGLLAAFGLNARAGGALRLANGGIRAAVHHPGTKGKHFYGKAKPAAAKAAGAAYVAESRRALRKVFSG